MLLYFWHNEVILETWVKRKLFFKVLHWVVILSEALLNQEVIEVFRINDVDLDWLKYNLPQLVIPLPWQSSSRCNLQGQNLSHLPLYLESQGSFSVSEEFSEICCPSKIPFWGLPFAWIFLQRNWNRMILQYSDQTLRYWWLGCWPQTIQSFIGTLLKIL